MFDVALVIIACVMHIGGIVLIVTAFQRVSTRPTCFVCGYVLEGISPGTQRCPECGGALTSATVCASEWRRDTPRLALGIATTAGSLVVVWIGHALAARLWP